MKFNVDDLIEKGLVKKKTYTSGKYAGLSVLKYSRKVFYDNLWSVDNRLLETRGIVVDEDDNVIVLPFKKVFNLGENYTKVDPDLYVVCPRKINGFMAAATITDKYGLIISTTGTLDSEYAELARKWIEKGHTSKMIPKHTYLFEICDKSDPHVVSEDEGAYLIGVRKICLGDKYLLPECIVGFEAATLNYERPNVWEGKFKDLPLDVKHEGYMVRDAATGLTLCKVKSKHYLSKKALQRVGKSKASKMWNNPELFKQQLDEEFYEVFDKILDTFTQEEYLNFDEQERRLWLENYFEENT